MSERLGRYTLDKKIAEGGMAEVFLARQSGPRGYERSCVVKRMLAQFSDDHVMVQMFLDEARLAAQLSHPNIAQLYDFGEEAEKFYLAFELVPGSSLAELIARVAQGGGYLPFPVVARIAADVAQALDYAHGAIGADGQPLNVIHRDVTPHNILVSTGGTVKLIDFGIAKATSARQQTVAGMIKGNFAYMSPEQIRGEKLDRRSDIYSLGLVLYELLTNTRAFDGISDHALMEAVYLARFVPPTMLRPEIPARLLEILGKSLGKEPASRYPTAGEMARALERFITESGAPVMASQLADLARPGQSGKAWSLEPAIDAKTDPNFPSPATKTLIVPLGGPTDEEAPTKDLRAARRRSPPALERAKEPTSEPAREPSHARRQSSGPIRGPTSSKPEPSDPTREPSQRRRPSGASARRGLLGRLGVGGGLALGFASVVALGAGAWVISQGRFHLPSPGRRAVAVLEFKSQVDRPEMAWLSTAIAEMVGTELASTGGARVIPGENVARARAELHLSDPFDPSAESLARLKADLGADWIVSGAYQVEGDRIDAAIQVDVRVRRARDAKDLASLSQDGKLTDLPALISAIGLRLRLALSLPDARTGGGPPTFATPEATRLYADGLAALHRGDPLSARPLLEKAVAAAPENPLPYAALASAWALIGSDTKAAQMARLAQSHAGGLSKEDQLAIEARNHELSHDWSQAQQAYASLWAAYPDSVEYGLGLARGQYQGGDGRAALVTIEKIRAGSPSAAHDPRLDLEAARAAITISEYKLAHDDAARSAELARANGSKLLEAQALLEQGWAASYLGDNGKGLQLFEGARAICSADGDRACVAHALDWAGTVANDQGDYETAKKRLEEAIALAREIGDGPIQQGSLNNLALTEYGEGHLGRARDLQEQAVAIAHENESNRMLANFKDSLARILAAQGSADAEKTELQAEAAFQELKDNGGEAVALEELGEILLDRGDVESARSLLERGLVTLRELKIQTIAAAALRGLATVAEEEDDAPLAARLFEQENATLEPLGEQTNLANNQAARARLQLGSGHAAEAVASLKTASETLRGRRATDDEVIARTLLAAALRAQGDLTGAQQALDAIALQVRDSENPRSRIRFAIEAARLAARKGRAAQALIDLLPRIDDAHQLGLLRLELEARLAQAEIELGAGQRRKGISDAKAVNQDANAHGLKRLARLSQLAGSG